MILTDCFAYFGNRCTALNTLVCSKSPYCHFYKPESANWNRLKIEAEVDIYQSTKSLQGGTNRRYEKANTKSTVVPKGNQENKEKSIQTTQSRI